MVCKRRNVEPVGSVWYPLRELSPWLAVDGLVPSINVGEGREESSTAWATV